MSFMVSILSSKYTSEELCDSYLLHIDHDQNLEPKIVMLTCINRIASGDGHGIKAIATKKQRQENSKPSSNRLNMNEAQ